MRVELSALQKDFYKQLLAKHYPVLVAGGAKEHKASRLKVTWLFSSHSVLAVLMLS